jgi:O-antigen/teichoic acid export membrane protein
MIDRIKKLDSFSKNIILVFLGTSLTNFFNLLYQLLIAHKLSVLEFAAFNSLLSLFMVVLSPLGTIQMAVAKYCAQFYANNQVAKLKFLLSDLFKKASILAISTLLIFRLASGYIMNTLKISSESCGYILAALLASSWLSPLLAGGVQGLELFGWLTLGSVVTVALKLALAFIFILLGYSIAGALGAFLVASLIGLVIYYLPLRHFIYLKAAKEDINYKEILTYLLPVAISNFCFITLVSFDMVLVRYFFAPQDSGLYSLAQMVGKIFLFLPGAISIVMFPRISGLNAKNLDTLSTLKRSLLYGLGLCVLAAIFYNLYPSFVLKVLTGKVYLESIILGRLFSISMSFFALLYIFITYFLSIKDFRFIKYLVILTILQFVAIALFHKGLFYVQAILCINSILLFCIHFFLVNFKKNS